MRAWVLLPPGYPCSVGLPYWSIQWSVRARKLHLLSARHHVSCSKHDNTRDVPNGYGLQLDIYEKLVDVEFRFVAHSWYHPEVLVVSLLVFMLHFRFLLPRPAYYATTMPSRNVQRRWRTRGRNRMYSLFTWKILWRNWKRGSIR